MSFEHRSANDESACLLYNISYTKRPFRYLWDYSDGIKRWARGTVHVRWKNSECRVVIKYNDGYEFDVSIYEFETWARTTNWQFLPHDDV